MDEVLNEIAKRSAEFTKRTEQEKLNLFFQEIKHGDAEHVEWLAKKIESFFNVSITR